jgi:hypothetical protein
LTGTPVAGFILLYPSVQIKPIKSNALLANGNFREIRPHFLIETVAVHPQIEGGVPQPD